jgi:hypothetical protein
MYVLLGLLAAVTCYGFLSSSGVVEGKEYGVAVKLGGAIVALAVPIDADARLEILSNSGAPMFSIPLKVTDTAIIPPRGLEPIHLDGFMLKDQYAIALTGKTAVIKLRYDHSVEKSEMEFQTEFTFDKKTVPATR